MAAARGFSDSGVLSLPRPSDSSQPRFASGCRWGTQGEERVVLFPEGMIRVQGTGQNILELCDGQRTVQEIVTTLAEKFSGGDPAKIREDVGSFLEALQQKRIVDY
jgi:pyrroloquinoline quinone biosynthesis protein D